MKTKLKLKKQVWISAIIIIFLIIGFYAYKNIHAKLEYQKTNEYKLLQLGYTKEEIELLNNRLPKDVVNDLTTSEKNSFLLSLIEEKYYIASNLTRYLAFYQNNTSYTAQKVVAFVNTNNDSTYYDNAKVTNINDDTSILVNKHFYLEENYEPSDLVEISNKYYYGSNHKMRASAYQAFIDMWAEAKQEDIYLIINSSYRTYDSQKKVYDDYKNTQGTSYADKIAARPGYSEHQTGLSLDIFSKTNTNTSNFKGSKAHLWLQANAHRFGYIERYQSDTKDITGFEEEAWHWRYVGVEIATYIHDNNLTFDEYYAYFIANKK